MVYLQGGPSHLDLWDPKENVPDKIRSAFKTIPTKIPGINFTEILPKLATGERQVHDDPLDELHAERALQSHGGDLPDHDRLHDGQGLAHPASSSRRTRRIIPNFGSNIIRLKPPTEPMLPFVMLPRPLQESNVVGKGGTAGFLGKGFDPYTLFPDGDDLDMTKMNRIKIDDLKLRPDVFAAAPQAPRARCGSRSRTTMPDIDKAVAQYHLDEYYDKALNLIASGKARDAFAIDREADKDARALRHEHLRPKPAARAAPRRSRHARRRGHLAEGRELRQPFVGHARRPDQPHEEPGRPDARQGLQRLHRGSRSARPAR